MSMISGEGEVVKLLQPVEPDAEKNRGSVVSGSPLPLNHSNFVHSLIVFLSEIQERWLLEMESAMRESLKDIGTKALEAYPLSVRTQFVQEWTGMIVLAADNYFWTKDVEQGMRAMGLEGVKKVEEKMKLDLADIVALVRGSISKQVR
jgi:hypothetical protein